MLWILACGTPVADRYEALVHQGDGAYRIEARSLPGLEDPSRMQGADIVGYAGGVIAAQLCAPEEGCDVLLRYEPGRDLDVRYVVSEGVARPLDVDALVLFSFYGDLLDTRSVLEAAGIDVGPLFPLVFATSPAMPDLYLSLSPFENAAYAPSSNTFVLLPDLVDKEVPLAANAGVVAHEFGHGVFQLATTGDPYGPGAVPADDPDLWGATSLDEGFADMIATLVTGDPRFLEASLPLPERDVSGDATALAVEVLPDAYDASTALLDPYDPYPLGTVFASTVWDVYEAWGDAAGSLAAIYAAAQEWAAGNDHDPYRWLDAWVAVLQREQPAWVDDACEAIAERFAGVHAVAGCS